jgi:Starch synthase catalytic domain.
MKILVISRKLSDGEDVSEYVKYLTTYLADAGHKVTLAIFEEDCSSEFSERVSVEVFSSKFDSEDFYNRTMMLNNRVKSILEEYDFDLVHANDWSTVSAGISVSGRQEIPLFVTLHSTENQRGFANKHSSSISEMEWKGVYNSEKVFVNNKKSINSVLDDLDAPRDKVELIDPISDHWPEKVLKTYRKALNREEGCRSFISMISNL